MLHLLLGRAKTGKTTRLYQAMRENGKHRPQVLIVPEQYSHEAERRLCQELGAVRLPGRRCSPSPDSTIGCSPKLAAWLSPCWTVADSCCSCTRRCTPSPPS